MPHQLIFFFPHPFLADLFVCIFFYLSYFHCGTRIRRWRTALSNGSIVRYPPLINEWIWGTGRMINGRKNSQVLVRGLFTLQHFMLQIPYGHSLDWTRTLALRNRRLIAVTRHSILPSFIHFNCFSFFNHFYFCFYILFLWQSANIDKGETKYLQSSFPANSCSVTDLLFIISSIEGIRFAGFDYRMSRFSARCSEELG